ncbi:MAG: peptidylprolyl isomerase [Ignavibacteria bacterium]|nr:peptidylprolyl isomerase [Ignavibacteria bacterium]
MKSHKTINLFILTALIAFTVMSMGCNKKNKSVVAEVGPDKILMYEFEDQFSKTMNNNTDTLLKTTLEQRKEFLDLMIKLRLKVLDATEKGYLNSPDIKNDLDSYKKNYMSAFLVDRKVTDPYIKELYEMKKYEVRASHILINLTQTPTPEDSVKAYEKAKTVIDKLKNGEDFKQVAGEFSEDPSAKVNGGDLYYFTGGMTVPEFEEAVFKLNKGDFTKTPVRTMFGLHIVLLTDKRKRNDGIRASHILIQDQRDSSGNILDSTVALNKINEISAKIKGGADFGSLAMEYSQDPGSATKGGDLGVFDRRRMVQPFDSAAFSLKVGEVSGPVRTPYGWHLIKVTEIKEYPSFDKAKENLKAEFKRGMQYKTEYEKFVAKTLKDYKFTIDESALNTVMSKIDSTKTIGNILFDSVFTPADKGIKLATYKDGAVTLGDLIQNLTVNREQSMSLANKMTFTKAIEQTATNPVLTAYAEKENIEKDDEYQDLLKEYTAGLLREKIDLEEITSKIKISDDDIQNYYNANIAQFQIKEGENVTQRPLEEAKAEITNVLRQQKFAEYEKNYIETLKQKYPVKVNTDMLLKAFKD